MVDDAFDISLNTRRVVERMQRKIRVIGFAHRMSNRMSNHTPGKEIGHHCQVQQAFIRSDRLHVGHPHFIGRVCCEATIQPIARDAIGVPRIGGGFVHTLFARFQAGRTHNSCDAVSSSDGAARHQFRVNARTSVRLAASPEHGGDRDGENIIFGSSGFRVGD